MSDLSTRMSRLSPVKRELLLKQIHRRLAEARGPGGDTTSGSEDGPGASAAEPIPRRAGPGPVPVSFAQERLFLLDGSPQPDAMVCHLPAAIRLRGPLDVAVLERSINEIVGRHEILRTTFAMEGQRPVLLPQPILALRLSVVDLSSLPASEAESEIRRQVTDAADRPFDLIRGPLLRATLYRLAPEDHVLLLVVHHLVFDGWSVAIFVRELAILYEAFLAGGPSPLPALPVQYADFAFWERDRFERGLLDDQVSYWTRKLEGISGARRLPGRLSRTGSPLFCCSNEGVSRSRLLPPGAVQSLALPQELGDELQALSQREGVTLFMTILAALDVLLYRYLAQEEILVGSPSANRPRAELEGLIGFFPNPLVLRSDLSGDPTVRELLGRVRQMTLEAYEHQELPFKRLVELLQTKEGRRPAPLFHMMFVFLPRIPPVRLPGLQVSRFEVHGGRAMFNLLLSFESTEEGLLARLEYDTERLDGLTTGRMLEDLTVLLRSFVAEPGRRLSQLPRLLGEEESPLVGGGLSDREKEIVTWLARGIQPFVTPSSPGRPKRSGSSCCGSG